MIPTKQLRIGTGQSNSSQPRRKCGKRFSNSCNPHDPLCCSVPGWMTSLKSVVLVSPWTRRRLCLAQCRMVWMSQRFLTLYRKPWPPPRQRAVYKTNSQDNSQTRLRQRSRGLCEARTKYADSLRPSSTSSGPRRTLRSDGCSQASGQRYTGYRHLHFRQRLSLTSRSKLNHPPLQSQCLRTRKYLCLATVRRKWSR